MRTIKIIYTQKKGNIGSCLRIYNENDKQIGITFYSSEADLLLNFFENTKDFKIEIEKIQKEEK